MPATGWAAVALMLQQREAEIRRYEQDEKRERPEWRNERMMDYPQTNQSLMTGPTAQRGAAQNAAPLSSAIMRSRVAREAAGYNRPPEVSPSPPIYAPDVSPVHDLRRDVTQFMNLSPGAERELYNTSIRYDVLPWSEERAGNYQGEYKQGETPRIHVWGMPERHWQTGYRDPGNMDDLGDRYGGYSPGTGIAAHEFAHKWEFENIPEDRGKDWERNWWRYAPDPQAEKAASDARWGDTYGWPGSHEAYATSAEQSQYSVPLSPQQKGRYYPGLFADEESIRLPAPGSYDRIPGMIDRGPTGIPTPPFRGVPEYFDTRVPDEFGRYG